MNARCRIASGNVGFSLLEVIVVIAIVGVLAVMSVPGIADQMSRDETRDAATVVAGRLKFAKDRAEKQGIPQIVTFEPRNSCGQGPNAPFLRVVQDNDFSYSETPGDLVTGHSLPGNEDCDVAPYGEGPNPPPFPNMPLPTEDNSVATNNNSGPGSNNSGPGNNNSGPGNNNSGPGNNNSGPGNNFAGPGNNNAGGNGNGPPAENLLTNGTSFGIDPTGRPAVAFNERGIPVDPANPTDWASGAGGVYLTDNGKNVFGAVVSPLGDIRVIGYNPATSVWE